MLFTSLLAFPITLSSNSALHYAASLYVGALIPGTKHTNNRHVYSALRCTFSGINPRVPGGQLLLVTAVSILQIRLCIESIEKRRAPPQTPRLATSLRKTSKGPLTSRNTSYKVTTPQPLATNIVHGLDHLGQQLCMLRSKLAYSERESGLFKDRLSREGRIMSCE